jgi:hypothetical protein
MEVHMQDHPLVLMVGTKKLFADEEEYRWVLLSPEEILQRRRGELQICQGKRIDLRLAQELFHEMPVHEDYNTAIRNMNSRLPPIYELHVEHIPDVRFPTY